MALTFTNKAADEMKGRVGVFVPGLDVRANIGTFHNFCAQLLRQHGVHLGINPDFVIYSAVDNRQAVLEDALRGGLAQGKPVSIIDVKYLGIIDWLKSKLVEPASAIDVLTGTLDADKLMVAYEFYEQELRHINALDFNSLIFESFRL